jgi:hypothetical protein
MKIAKTRGRAPVMRNKVQAYMAKHPDAKPAEVAKACGCNPNYVYALRNAIKNSVPEHLLGPDGVRRRRMMETAEEYRASMGIPELKKANELQVGGEHYRSMTVQPWDALEAWLTPEEFRGYQKGVAIAYLARERKKGGTQDIEKAMHHLMKLVESDVFEGART